MKKPWRVLVGLVVIAGAVAVLYPVFFDTSSSPSRRFSGGAEGTFNSAPVPVLVATARSADVPVYIEGVGTGRALNTVLIRAQVDGRLLKLYFREGQDVKRGDKIAKIDPTLYQAILDQAVAKKAQDEAQLANARRDLERYVRLSETNSVTKQQADTQRATVAQLEAQVQADAAAIDSARATLDYTDIVSPIDGRTGLRVVDEGNLIHASDTTGIVTVSQIQPIAVLFNVPQQQLPRINVASAKGNLSVEALDTDGRMVVDKGVLRVVDNQIDQTTGTVRLKAEFPNKDLVLWPGAFINVRLLIETLNGAIVVPVSALQRGPTGPFVYVLDGDKAVVRKVTPGQQDEKQAVIREGLKVDEKVVTTGFARLADGARVSVAPDQSAEPLDAPTALHQGTGAAAPREPDAAGRPAPRERRSRREGASVQSGATQ
jgi:multidrug efflux system membrane fusion protein